MSPSDLMAIRTSNLTESMTIGDFYDHHRRLGHFQILPKHAKMVKGNVLPIDLLGVRIVLLPSAIAQQFFVV